MERLASVVTLALLGWAIFIYNRLVRDRNRVLAAWSDIDVQLKRRHDLIPQLVEAVRHYAAYEQATLSAITALRSQAQRAESISDRALLETGLGEGLQRLIALAEHYPQLKASSNFLDLQQNLTEVENQIQYARRYYNGTVRNFNIRIDSFPDLLMARLFGYHHASYFQLAASDESQPPEQPQ